MLNLVFRGSRVHPGALATLCLSAIVGAITLQHLLGWIPCPLCIAQRVSVLATMLFCVAAGASGRSPAVEGVFRFLATASAGGGLYAAYSQLKLIWGPPLTTCGPGLRAVIDDVVQRYPALEGFLSGPAECEEALNSLLGLPLAAWTMGLLVLVVVALWVPVRKD